MLYRYLLCAVAVLCFHGIPAQELRTHTLDSIKLVNIKNHNAKRSTTVSVKTLKEAAGETLADVLRYEAGMSVRKAGASISKPVIDGQTNTRILLVTRGQKLETQDWADNHAPEIDPFGTPYVKIVRGAEGVRYGPGAMGGVIIMEPRPMNFNDAVAGEVQLIGASNSGKSVGNLMLEGGMLKNKFAWRLQSSGKYAGDYRTAAYYVNNTGVREANFSGDVQYRWERYTSKWSFSRYNSKAGIFYGSLSGNIEQFRQMLEIGMPLKILPFSDEISAPYQLTRHTLARTQHRYAFSSDNILEINYGYQQNHRKEFEVRRLDRTRLPSQNSELESHSAEITWENKAIKNLKVLTGAGILRKENFNVPGTGVVPPVPNYVLHNYDAFLASEYAVKKLFLEVGGRYDYRATKAAGYNTLGTLYGGAKEYSCFSWNTGARYDFSKKWSVSANAGLAWRSPEPYELYISGKQHGIPVYFVGDENLQPEKGWKMNTQIKRTGSNAEVSISGFYQPVKNYIYSIPTHQFKQLFSGPAALFNFQQTDALYYGGDFSASFKLGRLNYRASASLVYAEEKNNHQPLPQVPPFSLNHSFSWSPPNAVFQDLYFKVEHEYRAKQNRFNPAFDLSTETPPAYHLFNFRAGTSWAYGEGKSISLQVAVENFTNRLYKNYTDLYRYFTHDQGIDVQLKTAVNF